MRRLAELAVGLVVVTTALLACNALVGVEDVAVRGKGKTDGGTEEEEGPGGPGGSPGTSSSGGVDSGPVGNGSVLAVGHYFNCLRKVDGRVTCWGDNSAGQLGKDPMTQAKIVTPTAIDTLTDVQSLCGGENFLCATKRSGSVACLGKNDTGQLGSGAANATPSTVPLPVAGLSGATQVVCGFAFACALSSGTVSCWGRNRYGELGSTTASETNATPIAVPGLANVKKISAGWYHVCAAGNDGSLTCWGSNDSGQLGRGGGGNQPPGAVAGLANVSDVANGNDYTCARAGNVVSCFGRNEAGQLGNGMLGTSSSTPTAVTTVSDPSFIASGSSHGCVVRTTGRASCWGEGQYGALGAGASPDGGAPTATATPVSVLSLTTATQIGGGRQHTCALTAQGEVYCWGKAEYGELGDGNATAHTAFIPQKIPGL